MFLPNLWSECKNSNKNSQPFWRYKEYEYTERILNFHEAEFIKVEIHSTETPLKIKFSKNINKGSRKNQKLTFYINIMYKFSINYFMLFTIHQQNWVLEEEEKAIENI